MQNFHLIALVISITGVFSQAKIGAYVSTPNPDILQYRTATNLCNYAKFDDAKLSILSGRAAYTSQRKKFPEQHFTSWGYGIEVDDCKVMNENGIKDFIAYLHTPSDAHSEMPTKNENYPPKNLYEQIWWPSGLVNPDNYWAYFIFQLIEYYKPYVKIYEVWNEPDYVNDWKIPSKWATQPPTKEEWPKWNGSIFQYIRLLRITYEVVKKYHPEAWVATGGIGYTSFLDSILRYTDNPIDGSVTAEYPAFGGAYFDCDAYHQYPQFGTDDEQTGEGYHTNGSDTLTMKVVILKKNHEYILKNHGFDGITYPKKLFIVTETGVSSKVFEGTVSGEQVQKNFMMKLPLRAMEYEINQISYFCLCDYDDSKNVFGYMGDYYGLGQATMETAKLKPSGIGRLVLERMPIGKMKMNTIETMKFREELEKINSNLTGIVWDNKFPQENEKEFYTRVYAAWIYCEKEESTSSISVELKLKLTEAKEIDWEGNTKSITNKVKVTLTDTPIFFMGTASESSARNWNLNILYIIVFVGFLI